MTLTELIDRLTAVRQEHGDGDVGVVMQLAEGCDTTSVGPFGWATRVDVDTEANEVVIYSEGVDT